MTLPLLPGYIFPDLRSNHHVSQNCIYKNGCPITKKPNIGIGGSLVTHQKALYLHHEAELRYDPKLTYGRMKQYDPPVFIPHFVLYDQKCLSFNGFFCQPPTESPNESSIIRIVKIIYFLEDDTLTIIEPSIPNAGYPQGRIVKRSRILNESTGFFWHWKDLNIGIDMPIYGIIYHLSSCDGYTKEFLKSQGVELNPREDLPDLRLDSLQTKSRKKIVEKIKSTKNIQMTNQVLRFFAVGDDNEEELKCFKILYYVNDNTFDVIQDRNIKYVDPPFILKKVKIPKPEYDEYDASSQDRNDDMQYFTDKDLMVGKTLILLGRRYFLYDCDKFTRTYYEDIHRIIQPQKLQISDTRLKEKPCMQIPPYNGFGTLEDSLQSWKSVIPKTPRKNWTNYLTYMNKMLRYTAVMDWVHPEDAIREFIIEYKLSDGSILIHELKLRNTGFYGGRFLRNTLVPKPGTDPSNPEYYTPVDFTIGAVIHVFHHRFKITGVDFAVYRYMQENAEKFSANSVEEARKYLIQEGHLKEDRTP